jgi:hypothetical protein
MARASCARYLGSESDFASRELVMCGDAGEMALHASRQVVAGEPFAAFEVRESAGD